jgi:hypothetical protein
MSFTTVGKAQRPVHTQVVVLYDPKTGAIGHMHEALFFSNARSQHDRDQMLDQLVRKLARERKPHVDFQSHAVLHAPGFQLKPANYRVDVSHKRLVEEQTAQHKDPLGSA